MCYTSAYVIYEWYLDEFFLDYFNNSGFGAFIQIMFGSLTFLVDTGFDFTNVGGSGIFFKKYLAFILVELRRLLEKKRKFKVHITSYPGTVYMNLIELPCLIRTRDQEDLRSWFRIRVIRYIIKYYLDFQKKSRCWWYLGR